MRNKTVSVWVSNNGVIPFSDRYDGEDFTIEPGEVLEMEAHCAKLVFGFGEEDKGRAIRRLGWAPTSDDMKDAIERLHTFSFSATDPAESAQTCLDAPASGKGAAAELKGTAAATSHAGKAPTNALTNIARAAANIAPG